MERLTRAAYRSHPSRFRTALIAPSHSAFGVGRMYEAFISEGPEDVRVFREPAPAFDWLGLPVIAEDELHARSEPEG